MIHLTQSDCYELLENPRRGKLLYLGKQKYVWLKPKNVSEIMLVNRRRQPHDTVLSVGQYRYYLVQNEASLTDGYHLELEVGHNHWQGYIIHGGLPDEKSKMSAIAPTHERITGEHKLWPANELTNRNDDSKELPYGQKLLMTGGTP